MKNTLALVLMVFGLVGCTSSSWETYKVYKPEFNLKNSQVTQNIKNGIPAGRFNNFCTFDGGWPGGEETQQLVDITQFNLFVQNAQATDNNKINLLNDISKRAYNRSWTKYSALTPVLQRDEILDFQNFIFSKCFDTIPQ